MDAIAREASDCSTKFGSPTTVDFDDVMLTRGYSGSRAYAQSKLAQIMFTFDLARELDPERVTANCLHPATYMATTMVRQSGVTPISTVEEGAEAILNLAAGRARRTFRPVLQRTAAVEGEPAGL